MTADASVPEGASPVPSGEPRPGSVVDTAALTRPPIAVSVVIPTYNSRPLLAEALDSLTRQTLPAEGFEVIVVDDGSSDDTWDYLKERASRTPHLRTLRQPPSGRPSVGRNRGLGLARGRYVFFLDADDYLAPEALLRMVEFADRHHSDVVIPRVTPVGDGEPPPPVADNVVDADLVRDAVWKSLAPGKLFRRELIDRLGLTFPEDQVQGEDQVFVATCLFAATRVSLLRDGDYHFRRMREDGKNISKRPQTLDNKRLTTTRMTQLVVANTAPGQRRDALLRRVMLSTLAPALNQPFQRAEPVEREEFLRALRADVLPHLSDALLDRAGPFQRLRFHTARAGNAAHLCELNEVVQAGVRYRVETVPGDQSTAEFRQLCYDLSPDLNALLGPRARQAKDLLTLDHRLRGLHRARGAVQVEVELADDRIDLEHVAVVATARKRRMGEVLLDRRPAADLVTFSIDPLDLAAAVADAGGAVPKSWRLVVRSYQLDTLVAVTALEWPIGLDPAPVESPPALLRSRVSALVLRAEDAGVEVRLRAVPPLVRTWRRSAQRRTAGLAARLARTARPGRPTRAERGGSTPQRPGEGPE